LKIPCLDLNAQPYLAQPNIF